MKKLFVLSALAFSTLAFTSCDKAEKLLFQPFESPLSVDVVIAQTSDTEIESTLGSNNLSFNLDEEVKAQTDGKVDGSVVGAMYLNEVAITLLDGDEANNLSNFEYVTLSVTSGSSTPVVFGPFQISEGTTNTASFTVQNSPNIKPFFTGSNVNFTLRGKAKTATTRDINSEIRATIKFDK